MKDQQRAEIIDCKQAERLLHLYVDRELSEVEVAEVNSHLEACENCRMRFRFEDGLRRLVRNAGQNEFAPQGLRDRIQRIRRR